MVVSACGGSHRHSPLLQCHRSDPGDGELDCQWAADWDDTGILYEHSGGQFS